MFNLGGPNIRNRLSEKGLWVRPRLGRVRLETLRPKGNSLIARGLKFDMSTGPVVLRLTSCDSMTPRILRTVPMF